MSGCVSIGVGGEPPTSLLTLRADESIADNAERSIADGAPIAVNLPVTPRLLDNLRVPVQVNDTSVAFVKQAFWADKPSRLFLAVLQESLAAQTGRLVLPADEIAGGASLVLNGTLSEFGYDANSARAVATYDALLRNKDGTVSSRRFRATAPVDAVEPELIGAALNDAANKIAADVGIWVKERL
jgi:cholesterol transport system auxiliary component